MVEKVRIDEGVIMLSSQRVITVVTERAPQFIDITSQIEEVLEATGIEQGITVVFSHHTTAAIRINEKEPLLLHDMERFLEQIAPPQVDYKHNDFTVRIANMGEDECPNGHSHCQHLCLGTSETIPVNQGKLILGKWQRIFLVELDRPREREITVQIIGY
ncbi:secondary thiamine-phosphate synthase enzyme YjbQ [Candidatus Acetothermia bacterium]|nr:secondary thiamine-phosphate synthase enzyme YjbQ [Candidatus Acetothermia bacterium]